MALSAGTRLGPYEILGPIGAGGMGEVHRARDTRLGRDVAVKVLPGDASHTPERLHRFEQEARLAGSLSHPNVLTLFDVGSHEGSPYLVTELLEGRTLREVLVAGPLPSRKAVEYGTPMAAPWPKPIPSGSGWVWNSLQSTSSAYVPLRDQAT